MASESGHTTTVDVLLRQGADPNIADNVRKSYVSSCSFIGYTYTSNICGTSISSLNCTSHRQDDHYLVVHLQTE